MNKSSKDKGFADPFAAWQNFLGDAEDRLNKTLTDMMSTPQFGDTSRQMMQAMTKYQQSVSEAGSKYFNAINLPSRDDIKSLGARLGVMEERLARIEALLSGQSADTPAAAPAGPRPKRTRKPPQKADSSGSSSKDKK